VAAGGQALGERGRQGGLGLDQAADRIGEHPWHVLGLLDVQAVLQEAREEVHVAVGLVVAAHDAVGHDHAAVAGDHAGDDGVERALARGDAVGVIRVEHEALGAVVQHYPGARRHQAAAEVEEQGVDEAAGVTVLVDHRDVDRALVPGRGEGGQWLAPARGVDRAAQLGGMGIGEQPVERHCGKVRVGEVDVAVLVGQAAGLDLAVQALGGRRRARAGVLEAGDDAEQQESYDALAGRRALVDLEAAVGGGDRRHVAAGHPSEVLQGVQPAMLLETADDVLGDRAPVEAVAALGGDPLEGLRQLRLALPLADPWRPALGEQHPGGVGVGAQDLELAGEVDADPRRDRIAVAGIANRRAQQFGERLAAVVADQPVPGVDRAGDGHRMGRLALDCGDPGLAVPVGIGRGRRPARAVVGDQLGRALRREEAEAVAADTGRFRLDHALHGAGGDRGVERVAAVAQHRDRGLGGERMGGAGHAVRRMDGRPPGQLEVSHLGSWMVRQGESQDRSAASLGRLG